MKLLNAFRHLTLTTGHVRLSPRAEVDAATIAFIRDSLSDGSGVLGNTGWAVLMVATRPGGWCFDLSHEGVEVARCWLATDENAASVLWSEAVAEAAPGSPIRPVAPWLAVTLLPDGVALLARKMTLFGELGDLERCVAWALLPNA